MVFARRSQRVFCAAQIWAFVNDTDMCAAIFGYLSDRYDSKRKSFMYIGLLSLALSTIFLYVGRTIGLFIAGRIFQGAAAAMVG